MFNFERAMDYVARINPYKPMPSSKKKKSTQFNRARYEDAAQDISKKLKRASRNPSGYLTKEAASLSAGKGLLSYTPPPPVIAQDQAQDGDESQEEDGFLAFEDLDESHPLAEQFKTFEKDLKIPVPSYPAPWLQKCEGTVAQQFTSEVKNWLVHVSPQEQEIADRKDLVARIQGCVRKLLRGVECHLFGSSATDMYLPMADVDMVIIPNGYVRNEKGMLYMLKEHIRRNEWSNNILVIGRARVPIVKFKDTASRLHVDISVGQRGGVTAIKTVQDWSASTPALRPLVLVVKQFLKARRLAEVFHGGLGGYATICLVKSFLENHPKIKSGEIEAMDNLGPLLFEFFEFYGDKFDCYSYALRMTGKMPRVLKSTSSALQTQRPGLLSIEDPNDHTNNVTKSSYNWPTIQKEFGHAADLLKRMMHESEKSGEQTSFLSVLLKNDKRAARHSADELGAKLKKLEDAAKFNKRSTSIERPPQGDNANEGEKKKKKPRKEKRRKTASPAVTPTKPANESQAKKRKDPQEAKAAPRAVEEIFEPADTSDSDDLVTRVSQVKPPANSKQNPIELLSSDEESRTKSVAKSKQNIKNRRLFWQKKNGI